MNSVLTASLLGLVLTLTACEDGRNGPQGQRGRQGFPGYNGTSCSVTAVSNGSIISCEDGTSTVVLNGTDGVDGNDGADGTPTAYSVQEIIKPCNETGSSEVLLKLYNGELLAHYSHGSRQYLALLTPGSYQLTDGSACNFTVNADMTVSW
jgi:hypothetical protein